MTVQSSTLDVGFRVAGGCKRFAIRKGSAGYRLVFSFFVCKSRKVSKYREGVDVKGETVHRARQEIVTSSLLKGTLEINPESLRGAVFGGGKGRR